MSNLKATDVLEAVLEARKTIDLYERVFRCTYGVPPPTEPHHDPQQSVLAGLNAALEYTQVAHEYLEDFWRKHGPYSSPKGFTTPEGARLLVAVQDYFGFDDSE